MHACIYHQANTLLIRHGHRVHNLVQKFSDHVHFWRFSTQVCTFQSHIVLLFIHGCSKWIVRRRTFWNRHTIHGFRIDPRSCEGSAPLVGLECGRQRWCLDPRLVLLYLAPAETLSQRWTASIVAARWACFFESLSEYFTSRKDLNGRSVFELSVLLSFSCRKTFCGRRKKQTTRSASLFQWDESENIRRVAPQPRSDYHV